MASAPARAITRRAVLRLAWPIILANAAVPLLGLVDTAVIGRFGDLQDLGAIALGSLIFNFLYWAFGFLRMGTTGFVAQSAGRGDEPEVRAAVGRALALGVTIGTGLLVLQGPIAWAAFALLSGDAGVEAQAQAYLLTRIWGAPATLATSAMMGGFIGLGCTRQVLIVQVVLSGINMALDIVFAGVLGWGARGIALGTAVSEWLAFGLSVVLVVRLLRARRSDSEALWAWPRILDLAAARQMLRANGDILLRTLCLLAGFAWFTDRGAAFGSAVLASNHILLQFVTFSAYFLDGYAHVAESMVGMALGAGTRARFDRAVRVTTQLAAVTALGLSALIAFGGELAIDALTDIPSVRALTSRYLPLTALYVLVSFAAFQLDGIFIGATRTRAMRNASAASLAVFLVLDWLRLAEGNRGLWLAFIGYVVARAMALAVYFPALRASVGPAASRPGPSEAG